MSAYEPKWVTKTRIHQLHLACKQGRLRKKLLVHTSFAMSQSELFDIGMSEEFAQGYAVNIRGIARRKS